MRRLPKLNTVIIKIGSSIISHKEGDVNTGFLESLSGVVHKLKKDVKNVVIVSSGAVACGFKILGFKTKPKDIIDKQACAAVGQARLILRYEEAFEKYGLKVAQVLITKDDLSNRRRYLNARYSIRRLLEFGVIPIINENDSVVVEELKYYENFGDNDNLSALVSGLLSGDLLLILSDVDGLYNKNPITNPDAILISEVNYIDDAMLSLGGESISGVGTGGMKSKLIAAKKALDAGCMVGIINGRQPENILRFISGEDIGTSFNLSFDTKSKKEHWIAYAATVKGEIVVDDGAVFALSKNKSLLPSGIVSVNGKFSIGDVVKITSVSGSEIGRGKVRYSVVDVNKIKGRKSSEIYDLLGYKFTDEVIHRDDIVFTALKGGAGEQFF